MEQRFKIYFTSDTHGHIFPVNYAANRPEASGLLNMAAQIEKDGDTLVLDGGDSLQGTPLVQYYLEHRAHWPIHPVAAAFNAMGLDYFTLGNHDFNFGYEALEEFLGPCRGQCLCANVQDLGGPSAPQALGGAHPGQRPAGGRHRHRHRFCERVGAAPEPGAAARSPTPSRRPAPPGRRCALSATCACASTTAASRKSWPPGACCRTAARTWPAASPGNWTSTCCSPATSTWRWKGCGWRTPGRCSRPPTRGSACGWKAAGKGRSTRFASRFLPAGETHSAQPYEALLALEKAVQNWLDEPIGALQSPIPPEEKLDAALHGSRVAALFNQVQLDATGADVSCTSLGNDPVGLASPVTMRGVTAAYLFANTLVVLEVTEEVLRQTLERCAAYFTLVDGQPQISEEFLLPKVEHYNYDFYAGLSYTFDLRRPVGSRVVRLTKLDGSPLGDGTFRLCTSNYRATGTGGYEILRECPVLWRGGVEMPDLTARYIRTHSPVPPLHNGEMQVVW